ncbi:aldolase [Rhodospirillaceae bacterium SYSU D60014]|uniref:aldolase n=1 Tax=Virgifigura deserti TaxID=2268457 RepID=UPI000E66C260
MEARTKDYFDQRATHDMAVHLRDPGWSDREKLALACRMMAREGHESGLAGQITARADDPDTLWTLRFGLGFDEATPDSFVRVGDDLAVFEGDGMANPATRFHLWVYRARPDVNCIIHTHPPYISALSMVGKELAVAHMDATPMFEDCAFLAEWPGVPIADDEGVLISEALGQRRAILLAHHGHLVACASIEESAVMAILMERAARMQIRAAAIGPVKTIRPERAREAHDYLLKPGIVRGTFHYFGRQVLRAQPDCLS